MDVPQTARNLKLIGLAMFRYLEAYGVFPPAYIAGEEGKPLLSWRVAILPYLDANDLHDRFRYDEPWDSDHNRELITRIPEVYRSPGCTAPPGSTVYLTIRGSDTVFSGKQGVNVRQIIDGSAYTILAVEAGDTMAVPWTKPDDLPNEEHDSLVGLLGRPETFWALFADFSVHSISTAIGPETLRLLFTRNDKTPLDRRLWYRDR